MRDMGAIQPCQIPKKKPAGVPSEVMRVPGKHEVSTRVRASNRNTIPNIFL